jgi:glutamate racemase
MKKNNRPIGIFDSGIGGLTVVKEVIRELPGENIIYFGDTARVPYGNKSRRAIIKFSVENVKFLLKFGVKFIIVACNTSSSFALAALRRKFDVPVLGVIRPAVKKAAEISEKKRVGIIATRATVASGAYQREIAGINPAIKSFARACPLFVPLAEEGWFSGEVTRGVAQKYLGPVLKKDIDTLILGCTHYPLLENVIRRVAGKKITFVDSAGETAREAKRMLERLRLCAGRSGAPRCRFFASDEPEQFRKVGRNFLGRRIEKVTLCTQ